MHCIYCGKIIAEVNGKVVMVMKGDIQEENGAKAIIVRCKNCKTDYSIMD